MRKLNLTLIQLILSVMQETLPVLRVSTNLNMQHKAVLQSVCLFSATDKLGAV